MISVAMTTYNGEKYLDDQLKSIMSQSVSVDEIVVCDDCSTDGTVEILKKYPVKLYENENRLGYKLNFKKAMSLCTGDYIFLCDQDDVWEMDKVEKMLSVMERNPKIHVCASSFRYIDENGEKFDNTDSVTLYTGKIEKSGLTEIDPFNMLRMNYFQGASIVMDKWICDKVIRRFDTTLEHDWLINLTAASYHGLYLLDVPLFSYRIHSNNQIGVSTVGESNTEHLKKTNQEAARLEPASNVINSIRILKEMNPAFYNRHDEFLKNLAEFCHDHIEYIKNRETLHLILQNLKPYYKYVKTGKARIMDVIFSLSRKKG